MPIPPHIERCTDLRATSIYDRFSAPQDLPSMRTLLDDGDLPLALKLTAVLGAFAQLRFPLRISDFRAVIPDAFWTEHCRFGYTSFLAGYVPIFWEEEEWFYCLYVGSGHSQGRHCIYFVANSSIAPDSDGELDGFDPPPNTAVRRYTIWHPFLQAELHDPTGIYLFK